MLTDELLNILRTIDIMKGVQGEENMQALGMMEEKNPADIFLALMFLDRTGVLTGPHAQDNYNLLLKHKTTIKKLPSIKSFFTATNFQTYFTAIASREDPVRFASAVHMLSQGGLLTGECSAFYTYRH